MMVWTIKIERSDCVCSCDLDCSTSTFVLHNAHYVSSNQIMACGGESPTVVEAEATQESAQA